MKNGARAIMRAFEPSCLYDGVGDCYGVVCLGFEPTQRRVLAVMSDGKPRSHSARGTHEYETRTFES